MSDQKISELTAITGANTADDDLLVIVDTSTGETKKITKAELTTTINNALIDGAPATLDTLNELAAALADDANFASTVTNSLAGKVDTTGGTMSGNLAFGDNDKAIFGAGSDLQIYHDGSHSRIYDSGTGDLKLVTNGAKIVLQSPTETMLTAVPDAEVTLYHNDLPKLATTSTGIDVTGTATMDAAGIGVAATGGYDLTVGDFVNFPTNAANYLDFTGAGAAMIVRTGAGPTNAMQITAGNDVSFYEDTGTTAKFFWDASAESLGIGTSSPNYELSLFGSAEIQDTNTGKDFVNNARYPLIYASDASGSLGFNGHLVLQPRTSAGGAIVMATGIGTSAERMRIDSAGSVGIGTPSPSQKLHLSSTGNTYARIDGGASSTTGLLLDNGDGAIYYNGASNYMRLDTNGTERMRIDSSGNLLVGTTDGSPYASNVKGAAIYNSGAVSGSVDGLPAAYFNRKTSDGTIIDLRKNGTTVGSIGSYAGAETYITGGTTYTSGVVLGDNLFVPCTSGGNSQDGVTNLGINGRRWKDLYLSGGVITSSDYRLKNDIQPMESSADKIKALNLVNFAWNDSGEREDGFIAHELQAVIPSAVRGEKDAVNEEGDAQYQGVDPLKLIPVLTKALQEALVRIDELEAKLP